MPAPGTPLKTLLLVAALALLPLALAGSGAQVRTSSEGYEDEGSGTPVTHIAPGESVTWRNVGGVHTVTSYTASFSSSAFGPGDSVTLVFDEPGAHAYRCVFHLNMQGLVVVA